MAETRYLITWIPSAAVERVCAKHRAAIDQGAAVWDFCQPEDLERTLIEAEARKALATAKRVLPEDEFGEVFVQEEVQTREHDEQRSWTEWSEVRRGVLNAGERSFCWL